MHLCVVSPRVSHTPPLILLTALEGRGQCSPYFVNEETQTQLLSSPRSPSLKMSALDSNLVSIPKPW